MRRGFLENFEKRLLEFEGELKRLVLSFFARKNKGTTYEIGNYLDRQSTDFMELKKYNPVKSWYRLRKTLENLEKEGVLRKELSGTSVSGLKFLNYRWMMIVNKK